MSLSFGWSLWCDGETILIYYYLCSILRCSGSVISTVFPQDTFSWDITPYLVFRKTFEFKINFGQQLHLFNLHFKIVFFYFFRLKIIYNQLFRIYTHEVSFVYKKQIKASFCAKNFARSRGIHFYGKFRRSVIITLACSNDI